MTSTQVDWTRKDFRSFLNAMERRGRDEVDVIARETSNETGKTEEEVRRYHTVFWARHKELADWERVIDKIEKGEKRLQRSKEIREALAEKIARRAPAPQLYFYAVTGTATPADPRRVDAVAAMFVVARHAIDASPASLVDHAGLRSRTSASR